MGDALDAFSSVPAEAAQSYVQVKEAILARFEVSAETYCLRFRSTRRKMGELYKMLLSRQLDQLNRWTQFSGNELKENILLEQFLQSLPTDLAIKLRERKPATAKEAAGGADDYDQAHRGELQCFECRKWGHIAEFCPKKQASGVKADVKPVMLSQGCPAIACSDQAAGNLVWNSGWSASRGACRHRKPHVRGQSRPGRPGQVEREKKSRVTICAW